MKRKNNVPPQKAVRLCLYQFVCVPLWPMHIVIFVLAGLLCGCRSSDQLAVQGEVLVNEQPLSSGSVVFLPTAGTTVPKIAAEVRKGRFTANGLSVGRYKVQIFDNSSRDFPWDDPEEYVRAERAASLPQQSIPPRYNDLTELEVEVSRHQRYFTFRLTVPSS